MSHDVFVSHSSRDKVVADAVVAGLERESLRCWVAPRDVIPGSLWGAAIIEAIESAPVMVLILSAHSNGSPQVLREVERAVATNTIIVPFRIEEIDPSGAMAYYLATEHWLDALTPPLEAHIGRLASSIGALLGTVESDAVPPPAPATVPTPTAARPGRRTLIVITGTVLAVLLAGVVGLVAMTGGGDGDTATVAGEPATVAADDQTAATDDQTAATASEATGGETAGSTGTETAAELQLTSFVWDDDAGWTEHASWVSGTTDNSFVAVLSAWNWAPDYPAVTVRFDDFMSSSSGDSFDTDPLSTIWQVNKQGVDGLVQGATAKSAGADVAIEDGQLVVRLTEGLASVLGEKRVDLFHGVNLDRDFDISVRFSLDEDFYSVASGGLSLTIVCTTCPEDFQAGITLLGNSYQSWDAAGAHYRTLSGTPANQLEGGLRLRGTMVEG